MLKVLEAFEGKRAKAYRDTKGIPTIGIGHVILPHEQHLLSATLSEDEIYALKEKDLKIFEGALNKVMDESDVKLTQPEYDALVSFMFNAGKEAFLNSTLCRKLRQGFTDDVAKELLRWVKPKEVISRRVAEYNIFITEEMFDEIKPDSRMTKKQVDIMAEYVIIYRNEYNKIGGFRA